MHEMTTKLYQKINIISTARGVSIKTNKTSFAWSCLGRAWQSWVGVAAAQSWPALEE